MELSERSIKTLEKEGFKYVYETQDAPFAIYEEHTHKGAVAVVVTEGSFEISTPNAKKNLHAGDRFDFPVGTPYSAEVGPDGCQMVIGEMTKDDF